MYLEKLAADNKKKKLLAALGIGGAGLAGAGTSAGMSKLRSLLGGEMGGPTEFLEGLAEKKVNSGWSFPTTAIRQLLDERTPM